MVPDMAVSPVLALPVPDMAASLVPALPVPDMVVSLVPALPVLDTAVCAAEEAAPTVPDTVVCRMADSSSYSYMPFYFLLFKQASDYRLCISPFIVYNNVQEFCLPVRHEFFIRIPIRVLNHMNVLNYQTNTLEVINNDCSGN